MPTLGPYHYGSHYSNSGIVLHYLVRLPPFTSMFLSYQGKYENPLLNQNLYITSNLNFHYSPIVDR